MGGSDVVTSLLRELGPAPAVLDALDWLFPEGAGPGDGHALGTLQGRPLVGVAEEQFRERLLGAMAGGRGLEAFLEEYGARFRRSLRNLFLDFLFRLESALPPPDLPQRYFAEVRHAHPVHLPRPLPAKKVTPPRKLRPRRRRLRPIRFSPYHADGEGDRDRHRAHGQGGADQRARGGEGGDPPSAAAADLQRQADER
ncbi:ubiquitin-like protein NEDD8 isoform 3-T3 [Passerculus sandwichensis]